MFPSLPGLLIALVAQGAPAAQPPSLDVHTPNTLTAPASVPSPAATLKDFTWLAGQWTGTGLGGVTDEMWSGPAAGAMMGSFRLLRDGKVVFYEFLTLVEQGDSVVLKLKHFNADLTGWEEKADFVTFRLLKVTPDAVYFRGLTFKKRNQDTLEIFLALRDSATGAVREEPFTLKRVKG